MMHCRSLHLLEKYRNGGGIPLKIRSRLPDANKVKSINFFRLLSRVVQTLNGFI